MSDATPNPVVRSTVLRSHPGWTVREYADGMFDVAHANGSLSEGLFSFRECLNWAYAEDRREDPAEYVREYRRAMNARHSR